MKREKAIEKLVLKKLMELSEDVRAEQLEIMLLEDWSETNGWHSLPKEIINEFEEGELREHYNSKKYDQVLMIWLKDSLQAVTNEYLCQSLGVDSIEGEPVKLLECPCCGYCTIGERANYEICSVCWWEDDGQDNDTANDIYGGPNHKISLAQGRYNFLKFGLYDPERKDLIKYKESVSKYERGRYFEIIDDYIIEKGTDWKEKVKREA